MEELDDFIERLMVDVEAKCGCQVYKKLLKDGGYHLRNQEDLGGGLFAGIWRQPTKRRFMIQVSEEYATKAGVANLADKRDDNGWYDTPACYYYVIEGNTESYNRAVKALSKICQVR